MPIKGYAISFFFINWRFATLNWQSPLWTGDRHFELAIRYFELAIATLNSRFASLNRTSDDHYEVAIATLSWRFATLNWGSPLWTGDSLLWTSDRHFEVAIATLKSRSPLWIGDRHFWTGDSLNWRLYHCPKKLPTPYAQYGFHHIHVSSIFLYIILVREMGSFQPTLTLDSIMLKFCHFWLWAMEYVWAFFS